MANKIFKQACFNELSVEPVCKSETEKHDRMVNFVNTIKKANDVYGTKLVRYQANLCDIHFIDSMSDNAIPLIYQSGYLTIKGYDEEFGIYRLGFPNKEVEDGFIQLLKSAGVFDKDGHLAPGYT